MSKLQVITPVNNVFCKTVSKPLDDNCYEVSNICKSAKDYLFGQNLKLVTNHCFNVANMHNSGPSELQENCSLSSVSPNKNKATINNNGCTIIDKNTPSFDLCTLQKELFSIEKESYTLNSDNVKKPFSQSSKTQNKATVSHPLSSDCRQQAFINNDIGVGDLAGYLEDLLYIPKKMSQMAELMYA